MSHSSDNIHSIYTSQYSTLTMVKYQPLTSTHTHLLYSLWTLSGTTRVSWYRKGKTNLDLLKQKNSEWQWHQLGHMQTCTSPQTDNHTSTPPLSFYMPDALPTTEPTATKPLTTMQPESMAIVTISQSQTSSDLVSPHSLTHCCYVRFLQ